MKALTLVKWTGLVLAFSAIITSIIMRLVVGVAPFPEFEIGLTGTGIIMVFVNELVILYKEKSNAREES